MERAYALQYINYLKDWSLTRHRVKWSWPLTIEEWYAEVKEEEEQDALDYEHHVRAMRCIHRYI